MKTCLIYAETEDYLNTFEKITKDFPAEEFLKLDQEKISIEKALEAVELKRVLHQIFLRLFYHTDELELQQFIGKITNESNIWILLKYFYEKYLNTCFSDKIRITTLTQFNSIFEEIIERIIELKLNDKLYEHDLENIEDFLDNETFVKIFLLKLYENIIKDELKIEYKLNNVFSGFFKIFMKKFKEYKLEKLFADYFLGSFFLKYEYLEQALHNCNQFFTKNEVKETCNSETDFQGICPKREKRFEEIDNIKMQIENIFKFIYHESKNNNIDFIVNCLINFCSQNRINLVEDENTSINILQNTIEISSCTNENKHKRKGIIKNLNNQNNPSPNTKKNRRRQNNCREENIASSEESESFLHQKNNNNKNENSNLNNNLNNNNLNKENLLGAKRKRTYSEKLLVNISSLKAQDSCSPSKLPLMSSAEKKNKIKNILENINQNFDYISKSEPLKKFGLNLNAEESSNDDKESDLVLDDSSKNSSTKKAKYSSKKNKNKKTKGQIHKKVNFSEEENSSSNKITCENCEEKLYKSDNTLFLDEKPINQSKKNKKVTFNIPEDENNKNLFKQNENMNNNNYKKMKYDIEEHNVKQMPKAVEQKNKKNTGNKKLNLKNAKNKKLSKENLLPEKEVENSTVTTKKFTRQSAKELPKTQDSLLENIKNNSKSRSLRKKGENINLSKKIKQDEKLKTDKIIKNQQSKKNLKNNDSSSNDDLQNSPIMDSSNKRNLRSLSRKKQNNVNKSIASSSPDKNSLQNDANNSNITPIKRSKRLSKINDPNTNPVLESASPRKPLTNTPEFGKITNNLNNRNSFENVQDSIRLTKSKSRSRSPSINSKEYSYHESPVSLKQGKIQKSKTRKIGKMLDFDHVSESLNNLNLRSLRARAMPNKIISNPKSDINNLNEIYPFDLSLNELKIKSPEKTNEKICSARSKSPAGMISPSINNGVATEFLEKTSSDKKQSNSKIRERKKSSCKNSSKKERNEKISFGIDDQIKEFDPLTPVKSLSLNMKSSPRFRNNLLKKKSNLKKPIEKIPSKTDNKTIQSKINSPSSSHKKRKISN